MDDPYRGLSAREREIMDHLHRRGSATVADLREGLEDAPTASAIRTMLARLEEKEHVEHARREGRNVYRPTLSSDSVRASALRRVMRTFFQGSPTRTVAAILDREGERISSEELDRLARLVAEAREREE